MAAPSPENYFKDKTLKNSAPFWNSFAARMITAIRETGDRRLIVIEPVSGGRPQALWNLSRFWDTGVIYGVRMFEPRAFTMQAGPRFEYDYPGDVGGTDYDRQQLENIMKPLIDFKRLNSVPVFAEYGGSRLAPGMGDYIADLVSVFEANNISHAYYSWGPAPNGSDLFSVEYGPESDSSSLEIFSTTFLPVLRSWMMNPAEGKRLTPLNGVKTFAYLIDMQENSIKELAKSGYDMLVIDDARSLSDMTGYNMVSDVKRLKESHSARGPHKIVLAYMSIGEAEDYRWYWKGISSIKDLVLGDDPDGWDGNYLVKYWHPKWRAVVSNYVDMAVADGFDGVYLDWVAAYEPSKVVNAAGIDKKDAKEEMVRLVCDISQAARSKGLVVVAQNGADLAATPGYLPCIDGIAQEEIWYAGTGRSDASMDRVDPKESSAYIKSLKAFQQYGLPIFSIDYTLDSHNANDAYFRAAEQGYIEYVTMRDLNAMSATPPPELSE
jgi:cysteinyl-tRNA synthetase